MTQNDQNLDEYGSLNVPIEHHPTIRYMVYNGYYKVMSNIPKSWDSYQPLMNGVVPVQKKQAFYHDSEAEKKKIRHRGLRTAMRRGEALEEFLLGKLLMRP